jgi:prevent-host-death family protein
MEARRRLGELLEGVYYRGDEVVIERAGKVMAVVIPNYRYEAIERERERFWQWVEKAQAAFSDLSQEEIEHEIDEAIREVRAERRSQERKQRAS